jgi:acetolactate synthase small subunit
MRRAQVHDLSDRPFVARELMLIKVRCGAGQRRELSDLADIFHGSVCDVSLGTITLEIQGKEDKMHALQGLLEPYGESLGSCVMRWGSLACRLAGPMRIRLLLLLAHTSAC